MTCACGRTDENGQHCVLGATHETLEISMVRYRTMNPHLLPYSPLPMPWETQEKPKEEFPW